MAYVNNIPRTSLVDEKLHGVSIHGLEPRAPVTVHLNVTNGININCDSVNIFVPDDQGKLDLDYARPLRLAGLARTYHQQIDSMGMFRTLINRQGWDYRFWSADVSKPLTCTLSVYYGMMTSWKHPRRPLAVETFERHLMAEGVTRYEVNHGRVRGTMFLPQRADKNKPCILTLHGGTKRGKVCEDIAALLASRGFPSLALGYFGLKGLPKQLYAQPLDMSYFEEAINYVTGLPETDSSGVGLWGISKGGEVCLSMCAFFPDQIKAVTLTNCMLRALGIPVIYKDQTIKTCVMPLTTRQVGPNLFSMRGNDFEILNSGEDSSSIPFWNTNAPFLYVASGDDHCIDSYMHGQKALESLAARGKGGNFKLLHYPQMGHLTDLPYSSVATSDANPGLKSREHRMYYGGDDFEAHSLGQEDAWKKTIEFYEHSL